MSARPPAAQPLPASPLPSALDPHRPRRSPRRRRRGGQTRFGWGCQAGRDSRESWPPTWQAPTADKRLTNCSEIIHLKRKKFTHIE